MKRGRRLIGATAAGLLTLVAGCTFYPKVVILNHTGRDLTIHFDDLGLVGWNEKHVLLKDGKSKKLVFGALIQPGDRFTFTVGRCSYDYRQPEGRDPYWDGYSDVYLVLQVEPDLQLYVRPEGLTPIPGAELRALQTEGFPLRPVARRCG